MKNEIHMLKSVTGRQMNSFIITCESGKVIAIDGGWREDAEYFLNYLREVTGEEKPKIDAWFLSHSHSDHVNLFFEVIDKYRDAVEMGRIYYNFPSVQFLEKEDKDAAETAREFYEKLPVFADKICIVSGGDVINVGEAEFEILYSPDFELNRNVCNNSSIVFKMTLGGRTAMFTGDCGVEAGEKILRLYKDSGVLKCDICQMANHGQNGCDRPFYEAVAPEICLWCTPQWLWDNDAGKGYNTHCFKTIIVREWMKDLGVKTDYIIKDGTQVCKL